MTVSSDRPRQELLGGFIIPTEPCSTPQIFLTLAHRLLIDRCGTQSCPSIESVWLLPMTFTGLPLDFRGFMNIVGAKGKDGFGNNTYTEILARPQLQLDLGKMLFKKPHTPDGYLALELWEHKFGNGSQVSGSEEVSPVIGVEYHF